VMRRWRFSGGPGGRVAHRFSRDSPLEEAGFEPPVPGQAAVSSGASGYPPSRP
jgi:hypothetical protein